MPVQTPDRAVFALPRRAILGVVGLGIAQAATLVCSVVLLRRIISALLPASVQSAAADRRHALILIGLYALCAGVLGMLRAAEFSLSEAAGYEVVRRARMAMYAHMLRMTPSQLRGRARGGLLLRFIGDLSMLRMWLSRGVLIGTSSCIVLVVGIGAAIWMDPVIGLVLGAVLCVGAVASLGSGTAMQRATRIMRRRRSLVIGNLDEQLNALEVVQMAGRSRGEYARLGRQNDALTRALVRVARLRGRLRGLAVAFGTLAVAAVLAAGVTQIHQSRTTLAVVVVEIEIARFLVRPVRAIALAHDYWHRGLVSKEKILEFLRSSARPVQDDLLARLRVPHGDVVFDQVHVPGALSGFSAVARRRQIIAIVGDPGSGAETLLELVARLVDPSAGAVRIDEQDLSQTAPWSAGAKIGYYRPDLPLMRGTIGRNLSYAMPDAEPEEIQRLVLGLGLDGLMDRLGPAGVRAWVTEGGRNLAPHDRNLIALARAIAGSPRILLLSSPLEGLHPDHRRAARELILRHRGTVLWHTSEPEDLAGADEIWFVADGRLERTSTGAAHAAAQWERGLEVPA